MTTIAMGAGMMPIAFGFGTDPSFRAPMAIVVIGGLITSTLLTLVVVPTLYRFFEEKKIEGRRAGRTRGGPRPSPGTMYLQRATGASQ